MELIVQKYGGTSVANKERLEIVANNIINEKNKGNSIVVVVSAQGKTTDGLINLASTYVDLKYPREMDILLSTGELQTVALLTMLLKEKGCDAIGLNGEQAGIITDSNFSSAKILTILTQNMKKHLKDGKVVVVAGFQGVDKFGNTTTLGRGGSDLSAVAIAASLKAKKCEIYTDVDGVYTGDPRVIKRAKLLENISYEEMLEAASAGAKVLHNRSVAMGKKYNTEIIVKHFSNRTVGTKVINIDLKNIMENYGPKIINTKDNLSKIDVIGSNLLDSIEHIDKIKKIANEHGAKIYMLESTAERISIIVDSELAQKLANEIHDKLLL